MNVELNHPILNYFHCKNVHTKKKKRNDSELVTQIVNWNEWNVNKINREKKTQILFLSLKRKKQKKNKNCWWVFCLCVCTLHCCCHWFRPVRQFFRSFLYCVPLKRNSRLHRPIRSNYNLDLEFVALSTVVTMLADALDVAMCPLELVAHIDLLVVVPDLPIFFYTHTQIQKMGI